MSGATRRTALKILQQTLASILTLALAYPAWATSDVVGTAVQTQAATVHESKLVAGSTVYSGDAISAAANGRAQVAISGGGRVDVLSNSTVRVDRKADEVQLTVERGTATFQTKPESQVVAVLEDVHVRAPKRGSALGIVGMESPDSAL